MKNILKITTIVTLTIIFASCSQKDATLRRLDDVHRAEKRLSKDPADEDTIRQVLNAAQNGNREVRAESLWILGNAKTQVAYSDFLRYSVEDPDFNVRSMAILGLSQIEARNPQSIERIKRAISDTDLQVQIEALRVAGQMLSPELINPILGSLSSKNKWVRMAAIEALKDYKDKRVDNSLKLLSTTDPDYAVRSLIKQVIDYRTENNIG